jgi:hypothetical protein
LAPNHWPGVKMRSCQTLATDTTVSTFKLDASSLETFFWMFWTRKSHTGPPRGGGISILGYVAASKLVIKSCNALLTLEKQFLKISKILANSFHDAAKLYIGYLYFPAPRADQHCLILSFLFQLPILWRDKYQFCLLNRIFTHKFLRNQVWSGLVYRSFIWRLQLSLLRWIRQLRADELGKCGE